MSSLLHWNLLIVFAFFAYVSQSAQQLEPIKMQVDDDSHTFELPTHNTATGSKRKWEYDVPECSILGVEDKQMLEMPNLESVLGNSLQSVSRKSTIELYFRPVSSMAVWMDMSGCQSTFHYLRLDWDISTTIRWIAKSSLEFGKEL